MSAIARLVKPNASAVERAVIASGPVATMAAGTPSASHEMASRELRDVHVAQSPAAITKAACWAAIAFAQRKGSWTPSWGREICTVRTRGHLRFSSSSTALSIPRPHPAPGLTMLSTMPTDESLRLDGLVAGNRMLRDRNVGDTMPSRRSLTMTRPSG